MTGYPKKYLSRISVALPLLILGISGCQSGENTDQAAADASSGVSETAGSSSATDSSSSRLSSQLNNYFDKNRSAAGQFSGLTEDSNESAVGDQQVSDSDTGSLSTNSVAGSTGTVSTENDLTAADMPKGESDSAAGLGQSQQTSDGEPNVDVNRLIARIGQLTEVQRTAETTDVMRETLIEQADLAKQIFDSSASFSFKITAVKTRIHALTILDRLKEPSAGTELRQFCRLLMERSEPELNKMGVIGLVSTQLRSYLSSPNEEEFEEAVATVDQYTKEHLDDFETGQELTAAASRLFTSRKREQAIRMMSVLSQNYGRSTEPEMIGLAETLTAQIAMASADFDKAVAKQIADEDKNMEHLEATVDQIMESGVTLALYNELISWLQLFEREARYKSIDLIAEKLQAGFREKAKINADRYVEVLDSLDLVRQRMALVGKPFDFSGIELADGNPFDPAAVEGKVVLVSFWSGNASPEERLQLQFETKNYEGWRPLGVAMVGFNMDNDPKAAADFFGNNPPRWINTKSDDDADLGFESQFAKRCVADATPYRILLDHEGKVAYIAVPVEALGTRMSTLLRKMPAKD